MSRKKKYVLREQINCRTIHMALWKSKDKRSRDKNHHEKVWEREVAEKVHLSLEVAGKLPLSLLCHNTWAALSQHLSNPMRICTFKLNTRAVWSDLCCIYLHGLYLLIQFNPNIYLRCLLWTDLCWVSILLGSTWIQVYLSITQGPDLIPDPTEDVCCSDPTRTCSSKCNHWQAHRGASVEFKPPLMQRHTGGPSGISWPAMQTRGSFSHKHLPSNLANTRIGQL